MTTEREAQIAQLPKLVEMFQTHGLRLALTEHSSPECYYAMDANGVKVAYFRIRHGEFTVKRDLADDDSVYRQEIDGFGTFFQEERIACMTKAMHALLESLEADA